MLYTEVDYQIKQKDTITWNCFRTKTIGN